jgi:hypothetical protein
MHRTMVRLAQTLAGGFLLMSTGCAAVHAPAMGALWMDVKGPIDAGTTVGSKTGQACASSILGLVATGDASIAAAAAASGISKIETVDHHTTHKVLFGEFCTVVHGN